MVKDNNHPTTQPPNHPTNQPTNHPTTREALVGFLSNLFGGGSKKKVADVGRRFELRGRTGQGSMSKVFQAFDKELGRTVCLKVLDKEKTAAFEARFKGLTKPTEGEVCTSLRHPNIVQTFEHGITTKNEPYLVMEWIEGLGLNFLVETKSPQLAPNALNYLYQLSEAIEYLHGQRYLHRDICPRNAMVTKEGVLKLIDFGLTIPYKPEFCRPGNRTGTADYLAPELIKRQTTDHRIDLFALGVTAFEMLAGGLPWERAPSSEETLRRRMNAPARDPRQIKPGLDEPVAEFLVKAVQRDPKDRFQSATAFKTALKGLGARPHSDGEG